MKSNEIKQILTNPIVFIDTGEIIKPLVSNFVDTLNSGEFKTFNKIECEIAFNLCKIFYTVIY